MLQPVALAPRSPDAYHGVLRPDPGQIHVRCGGTSLRWTYPSFIYMGRTLDPKDRDPDVELAPTPWSDIRDVNVADPRVKWYRHDTTRLPMSVSVDQLWK